MTRVSSPPGGRYWSPAVPNPGGGMQSRCGPVVTLPASSLTARNSDVRETCRVPLRDWTTVLFAMPASSLTIEVYVTWMTWWRWMKLPASTSPDWWHRRIGPFVLALRVTTGRAVTP